MPIYEYKVLSGSPTGVRLMPYASEKSKHEIGPGSYERKLNEFAQDGWEVVSSSTSAVGILFFLSPVATTILHRERKSPET